jgi:surface antigen
MLNKQIRDEFKLNAKNFQEVMKDLPQLSSLDVLRMAMHQALQQDNFEDAARYANMVAEYEQPKLQRIDQTTTTRTADLTDEELQRIISEEGLDK